MMSVEEELYDDNVADDGDYDNSRDASSSANVLLAAQTPKVKKKKKKKKASAVPERADPDPERADPVPEPTTTTTTTKRKCTLLFNVGDRVVNVNPDRANFLKLAEVVASDNKGSYSVKYDDGTEEDDVSHDWLESESVVPEDEKVVKKGNKSCCEFEQQGVCFSESVSFPESVPPNSFPETSLLMCIRRLWNNDRWWSKQRQTPSYRLSILHAEAGEAKQQEGETVH